MFSPAYGLWYLGGMCKQRPVGMVGARSAAVLFAGVAGGLHIDWCSSVLLVCDLVQDW